MSDRRLDSRGYRLGQRDPDHHVSGPDARQMSARTAPRAWAAANMLWTRRRSTVAPGRTNCSSSYINDQFICQVVGGPISNEEYGKI